MVKRCAFNSKSSVVDIFENSTHTISVTMSLTIILGAAIQGYGFERRWALLHVWCLLAMVVGAAGHGRLWEPPSRSSMWRLGYNTSINTDDNELSCGGFANQWIRFRGRCGVCGDPYQQRPRDNEHGGKYASGLITRIYPVGGVINVVVDLTANHLGYFELRLCPINDATGVEPEYCLDRDRLQIINGDRRGYRYYIRDPTVDGHVTIKARLPQNVYCKHCILQWKYHTGTRWACDRENRCEKGIGPQEEFYGCSDISIDKVRSTIYRDPAYFETNNDENNNNHDSALRPSIIQPREFMPIPTHLNLKKVDIGIGVKDPPTGFVLPETKTKGSSQFNSYLHGIIMDAMLKQHDEREVGGFRCKAAPAFAKNPIVNEWCLQTCPRNRTMCKPSMCSCKSYTPSIPALAHRKPLPVFRETRKTGKSLRGVGSSTSDDRRQVFKKLGMDKEEFASFIRRALETYNSVEKKKHKAPNSKHVAQFKSGGSHKTGVAKHASPGKNNIVFLTVNDKHRSPIQVHRKESTRLTRNKPILQEFINVLPRISDKSTNRKPIKVVPSNANKFIHRHSNKYVPRKVTFKQQFSPKTGISQYKSSRRSLSNDIYGLEKVAASHSEEPRTIRCVASTDFSHNKYMNKWCVRNCSFGFCPKSVCTCL